MSPPLRPPFSRRTAWDRAENSLARGARDFAVDRPDLVDLTSTNPTRIGLVSIEGLPALLGDPASAIYSPEPRGMLAAREAVASYYQALGLEVDPERVLLTASTSEAYAWIFKLLCDPGDEVLVPSPSYPLFEYLAGLEGVRVRTYPLTRATGHSIETAGLAAEITDRTRAIVLVHPNNPTGTLVRRGEARAIEELACARGIALVADEVFGDWIFGEAPPECLPSFIGERSALTFVLSGLSKVVCAPQLKLGWIVTLGPVSVREEARARLEVIADTYLSVGTPVQLALGQILARSPAVRRELLPRLEANLALLDGVIAGSGTDTPVRRLPMHGGWTALLELPRVMDEDAWVRVLALEAGALVQPGWFFDIDDGGTFALSLLAPSEAFERAVSGILRVVRERT